MSSDNEESSNESKREEEAGNPDRIQYSPDDMWFDYQALFDQTKNFILLLKKKEFEHIWVNHTDFEKNTLLKKYYSEIK